MKPLVGITIGDPNGIGPEVTVKALGHEEIYDVCRPLVIGSCEVLQKVIEGTGSKCVLAKVQKPQEAEYVFGTVNVFEGDRISTDGLEIGKIQKRAGAAAALWVKEGALLAQTGEIHCLCTAPINKEAIVKSGFLNFKGHTEYLGELAGVQDPLTMFVVDNLRVFFMTRHMYLKDAVKAVKYPLVYDFIKICAQAMEDLGMGSGKIAVAALNPHAGEGGLFGTEEKEEIAPAVIKRKEEGFNVEGPVPADSVFFQAKSGRYDAVISLYHDQGHIAAKTLDFERTVSVTLRLPYLRTSVDHGTAFDIAGKWIASEVSMVEAIKVAAAYYALEK